jgi:hypothetical protein
MLVAFDVIALVRAGVRTARTLNDVSSFDLRLSAREIWEKDLFFFAVFAGETEIPLAGG